ncbi:MAG TPA: T9SS type A sorting domain-containing protein [Bacteroidia bacterium]|nr:T9SS type A sorting domain-containing protein [Bacteroidia bacterium]HNU34811.1 T9SS type A sorting domain-containing protein [Bacteroidia bacterium]
MKKILTTFAFCILTILCNAQPPQAGNQFQYSYDQTGNRVYRYLVPARIANPNNQPEAYSQQAAGQTITVFPNPNRGKMDVRIDNLKDEQNASIKVFSTAGSFVKEYKNTKETTAIDIEKEPAGHYVISVMIDKTVKEWVVMKE